MKATNNPFGDGRRSVISEIRAYIDKELGIIKKIREQIPRGSKDVQLTHKRANLAGNVIALSKIKVLLKKKEVRMKK